MFHEFGALRVYWESVDVVLRSLGGVRPGQSRIATGLTDGYGTSMEKLSNPTTPLADREPVGASVKLPRVSIIIPMLNEREGLKVLFSSVRAAIAGVRAKWEIVVVDDGSTDGTRDVIADELRVFDLWKVVVLARNFGQQAAYWAGLKVASGEAVIFC